MPQYQVWYKGNADPYEFASIGRLDDREIVGMVLAREQIAPALMTDKLGSEAGDTEMPLAEIIKLNGLAPVKYTMDESEMIMIE